MIDPKNPDLLPFKMRSFKPIWSLAILLSTVVAASAQLPVVSPVVEAAAAPVGQIRQSERAIKQLPIHQRPNRLGHFYGNTVRRRYYGTLNVNRMHSSRPIARYFYLPR